MSQAAVIDIHAQRQPFDKRLPVHDIDAERAVIAACWLEPSAMVVASRRLSWRDFYARQHQVIWRAMVELAEAGEPRDVVTVARRLRTYVVDERGTNALQAIGGATVLGDMIDGTPAVSNLWAHVEIVRRLSLQRQAVAYMQRHTPTGYEDIADVQRWIGRHRRFFAELERKAAALSDIGIGAVMGQSIRSLDGDTDDAVRLNFSNEALGELFGAPKVGRLMIVTAPPGAGKTALLADELVGFTRQRVGGARVASAGVFCDQDRHEIAMRMAQQCALVDAAAVEHGGRLDPVASRELMSASNYVAGLPISLFDDGDVDDVDLDAIEAFVERAEAEAIAKGARLRVVGIDHLHNLGLGALSFQRGEQLNRGLKRLKGMAKRRKLLVIVLAQGNADGSIRWARDDGKQHADYQLQIKAPDEDKRPQPTEDNPQVRWDVVFRQQKARSVSGGGERHLYFHPWCYKFSYRRELCHEL